MTAEATVHRAHIALGGNIGDVTAAMTWALDRINSRADCAVRAVSSLYVTPPWGIEDQPDFINACAVIDTTLGAGELLQVMLDVERDAGRVRNERWGPRTLDLDLLDHDGRRIESDNLTLPHPRLAERAFVLVPLNEIAPELSINGILVGDLLKAVNSDGISLSKNKITY